MKVDLQSLETFNRLAHEGAQAATRSLTQLTGIEATVDVTRLTLVSREDLGEDLRGESFVGLQFQHRGGIAGETALVFDRDSVAPITEALVGADADGDLVRSSVEEVGNIMMSGFIDGWADYLGTTIDHSPPEFIEREGAAVLPEPRSAEDDQLFVFTSEVQWVGEPVTFFIYMVPEYEPMAELLGDHAEADDAIPIDKLHVFREMTTKGTEQAAEYVETMTGVATTAEVTRINFVPIEDVPKQLGTDRYVGTVVEFDGLPSGYLLVLFDEASARTVASALLGGDEEAEAGDPSLSEADEAAIEELGNILTSGFVDGWANVLQTTVDHTPPELVNDMGRSILDPIAARVGRNQDHAFVVDATMHTEGLDFTSTIHALPDEAELRTALEDLEVDRVDETDADVDQVFE